MLLYFVVGDYSYLLCVFYDFFYLFLSVFIDFLAFFGPDFVQALRIGGDRRRRLGLRCWRWHARCRCRRLWRRRCLRRLFSRLHRCRRFRCWSLWRLRRRLRLYSRRSQCRRHGCRRFGSLLRGFGSAPGASSGSCSGSSGAVWLGSGTGFGADGSCSGSDATGDSVGISGADTVPLETRVADSTGATSVTGSGVAVVVSVFCTCSSSIFGLISTYPAACRGFLVGKSENPRFSDILSTWPTKDITMHTIVTTM